MNLLLLALLPLAFPSDLALVPEPDTVLEKRFVSEMVLEGGELSVVMGGEPVPAEFLPRLDLVLESRKELRFVDRYVRTADGRVHELLRTFDEILDRHDSTQQMSGEGLDGTVDSRTEGTSPLEGETVRFTWDPDDGEYDRTLEGEARGPRLDGLVANADLTAFLEGAGDEPWTVPAEVLRELVAPGGDPAFEYEGDDAEDHDPSGTELDLDGELELWIEDEGERDGTTLVTVAVEGEVTLTITAPDDLEDVPVADGAATRTLVHRMDLVGELVWDAGAGHARSIELTGPVEAEVHLDKDPDEPPPAFESTVLLVGEASFAASFERVE